MKTVAILLNYNDADTTLKQLSRLMDCSSLDWLIVVDNASTDDSEIRLKHFVAKHLEKCVLVQNKSNLGYGAGNNAGLLTAARMGAKYALVLNPDTEIEDRLILHLVKKLDRHKELAMIAPIMVNPQYNLSHPVNTPGTKEHALGGATAYPIRTWIHELFESGPIFRRMFHKYLHYPREKFADKVCVAVEILAGSLYLCDVQKILEVGGYDEDIFLYMEESILGTKLKAYGYKSALFLKGHFIHRHSTTIKKTYQSMAQRQRLRAKSSLLYFKKYKKIGIVKWIFSCLYYKIVEWEDTLYAVWKR